MKPALLVFMSPRIRTLTQILMVAGSFTVPPVSAGVAGEDGRVGKIGFMIGRVRIVGADGVVRAAEAGGQIFAGDRVETGDGAHAHIQFVDNGLVSVRPGSRLVVEQYRTRSDDVSIRFRLESGVVRSITGDAAKAYKDRFRLNTPVAAIGVRGTDFVVKSDAASFKALVNEGAIVVAALGGNCSAQALGPCTGSNVLELSDSMGRVLVEMTPSQALRITPRTGTQLPAAVAAAPQDSSGRSQLAVAADVASAETKRRLPETSPPPVVVTPPVDMGAAALTAIVSAASLKWGRWAGAARPGDLLSLSMDDASADGRVATVANKYVGLFREGSGSAVLSTQLGQGDFALSAGSVSLVQANGGGSAGSVGNGWLKIDFAQRTFATELALSHPQTGAVQLASTGRVRDDGIFVSNVDGARVAGAVTFNGKEAGYLFDKSVPLGTLTGITLWKR